MVIERQETGLALPDEGQFRHDMAAINRFQQVARATMVDGLDYGVIPGTTKPTLLKPGAEKIAKLLGLSDQYEILDRAEDWKAPFFRYMIKCRLVHVATGAVISEGLGECNSMESKYRWRWVEVKCPECGTEAVIKGKEEYGGGWLCWQKQGGCGAKFKEDDKRITSQERRRVENDDIYSQVNTILKMSKKRSLVDAALSAGRLSDIFTQDIEDIPGLAKEETPPAASAPKAQTPTPPRRQQAPPRPAQAQETASEPQPSGEEDPPPDEGLTNNPPPKDWAIPTVPMSLSDFLAWSAKHNRGGAEIHQTLATSADGYFKKSSHDDYRGVAADCVAVWEKVA